MTYEEYFKGKKITIMGLAAEGRGLQDAEFALAHGAIVTVTDMKSEAELAVALERLKAYPDVSYRLGGHDVKDFTTADLVIRSASAPLDSPYLKAAHDAGVPVHTDESLFFELLTLSNIKITKVGITGTRGKSTVTQMIYDIVRRDYSNTHLGGNMRGLATLPLLPTIKAGDFLILELDSWKLQGLGEHTWNPHIAVFTTFMNDHMNYYKNNMDQYLADKANIFLYQTPDDYLIIGAQAREIMLEKYEGRLRAQVITPPELPADIKLKIPGEHNRYNASLAIAAVSALGIPPERAKAGIENFGGVPGRLEYLGEKSGIVFYNDNNATTPDATIAAVKAFPDHQGRIILIGGGADKELDYQTYVGIVPKYAKHFILFTGAATDKITALLPVDASVSAVDSMDKAVAEAWTKAEAGDIILLSPGAASFGVFKNEYDRGDQFVRAIEALS